MREKLTNSKALNVFITLTLFVKYISKLINASWLVDNWRNADCAALHC